MEANAVDGFVPDVGQVDLEGIDPLPLKSVGDLRKGRMRLTLEATSETKEGTAEIDVVLTWLRRNGGLGRLAWRIKVQAVSKVEPKTPAPQPGTGPKPTSSAGDVALIWLGRDAGYTDDTVGELTEMKGDLLAAASPADYSDLKGVEETVTTIVVNNDFAEWQAYLRSVGKTTSDAAMDGRRERYALGAGVVIANLTQAEKKIQRKHQAWEAKQNGNEEPPVPMTPDQQRRATAEAAHGVIALMPDFDQLLEELEK
jgi:hypothetical protein